MDLLTTNGKSYFIIAFSHSVLDCYINYDQSLIEQEIFYYYEIKLN